MPGQKGNKGNTRSTSTKPKTGTPKDKRRSGARSDKYPAGAATKAHGSPTNSHKPGTKVRKD